MRPPEIVVALMVMVSLTLAVPGARKDRKPLPVPE